MLGRNGGGGDGSESSRNPTWWCAQSRPTRDLPVHQSINKNEASTSRRPEPPARESRQELSRCNLRQPPRDLGQENQGWLGIRRVGEYDGKATG